MQKIEENVGISLHPALSHSRIPLAKKNDVRNTIDMIVVMLLYCCLPVLIRSQGGRMLALPICRSLRFGVLLRAKRAQVAPLLLVLLLLRWCGNDV